DHANDQTPCRPLAAVRPLARRRPTCDGAGAGRQLHLVRRDVAQAAAAQRARQVRLHGLGMELEQAGAPDLVRHADARPLESRGPEARADAGRLKALMPARCFSTAVGTSLGTT